MPDLRYINVGLTEEDYSHVVRVVHTLSIATGENMTMAGLLKKTFFEKYPYIKINEAAKNDAQYIIDQYR